MVHGDEGDENVEYRSNGGTGYNADFQNSTSALKNRMSESAGIVKLNDFGVFVD